MRILTGIVITAALASTAAWAQPGRLSDTAYMEAARCAGLANSAKLGSTDAPSFVAILKSQSQGRDNYILDKADEMQNSAKKEANHADDFAKARLSAELTGACASLKG